MSENPQDQGAPPPESNRDTGAATASSQTQGQGDTTLQPQGRTTASSEELRAQTEAGKEEVRANGPDVEPDTVDQVRANKVAAAERQRNLSEDEQTMPRRASAPNPNGVDIRDDAGLARDMRLVPDAGPDVGEGEVTAKHNEDLERGFRGLASDPTPNENYSVKGVTEGAPTPETHMGQRRVANDTHTLTEGVEPIR